MKKKPEARSYYELASSQGLSFVLPEPGFLEGVKTKDRPILKMHNVAYQCAATPLFRESANVGSSTLQLFLF